MRPFLLQRFFFILLVVIASESFAYSDRIYKELSTFTKVLDIVDQYYVKEVNEAEMMNGAINGMLLALDPHTVYLPPDIYKYFTSDTKGRFGGLGIEVSVRDGVLTVMTPIEGTPAWNAGIKAGDKIVAIDGKITKGMSLAEAVHLMRGSIGRKVSLTIWRSGQNKSQTVTLARELINVPSVKIEDLGEGYGYFRIIQFQEGTAKALKKEAQRFEEEHGQLKGMLFDLRDNPGGLLSESIKISDYFLSKGVIVSTKGRDKVVEVKKAHAGDLLEDVPLVVLINGGSASAAEIVAGALQDHGRAKLVGTQSFGKGSVQTVIDLENGGAVKVTVAHYFTPKDRLIDGKGIAPDLLLDQEAFKKKNKSKESDKKKVSREEFDNFQKAEALSYLQKMVR